MSKRCWYCGVPLVRKYFSMFTEQGKEVEICPKCRKIWEKYNSRKAS